MLRGCCIPRVFPLVQFGHIVCSRQLGLLGVADGVIQAIATMVILVIFVILL